VSILGTNPARKRLISCCPEWLRAERENISVVRRLLDILGMSFYFPRLMRATVGKNPQTGGKFAGRREKERANG
jgi:hypothetical protein